MKTAGPALPAAELDVLVVIPDVELTRELSVATEAKTASRIFFFSDSSISLKSTTRLHQSPPCLE
jgi:hypothetical protein